MGVIAPIYRCLGRPQTCCNWASSYLVEYVLIQLFEFENQFFVTKNLEKQLQIWVLFAYSADYQ